jgi:proteic killer suppression protein
MSSRRERGFRKIKIVDSSIEDPNKLFENESFCYSKKCFIISTLIAIIFILIIITLIVIEGKKKMKIKYFTNRSIYQNNKNINNYRYFKNYKIGIKQSNLNNNFNFNEEKKITSKTYNINNIIKDINKTIEKQETNKNENIKISIIIMNNNKEIENNFEKLFESIESQSFSDKETASLFHSGHSRKFSGIERIALRKLDMINAAVTVETLKVPPGNRLEALKGNRQGQYSVRVNDQWRICFRWEGRDAYDVEIVDYH